MTLSNFFCRPDQVDPGSASLLKRQLQWLLLLRVIVLTVLLGITILLRPKGFGLILPPLKIIAYFVAAIYLFTFFSAISLNKTNCYKQFTYLQLLTDTILVTFLVFFTGGSRSVFTIIYFFPIITGGLMLFRTGGLLFAAISTILYGAVLFLEYYGFYPVFSSASLSPLSSLLVVIHLFAVHGLIFFMIALLTIFLSERLRQTQAALTRATGNYDRLLLLYKQIFDDISTGIITVNGDGKISSFNRASAEITGYHADEVAGKKLEKFFPNLLPVDNDAFRQAVSVTRRDGESIPVGYSWAKLNIGDGGADSRVYTMQDLSRIKKMEEQVRQAEKMAAIGEMAAGVAHEFRNPLAAISGASEMLGQGPDCSPEQQKLTTIVTRECDRLDAIIRDFLQFSKPVKPEKKWFSINELIDETIQLIMQNPNWDNSCKFMTDIPEKMDCWGDPAQIKQVLINLIDNAGVALEGKNGEISITASDNQAGDDKENTIITVANNGPPIPENIIKKLFEPFFTTRKSGTGLGLAIVWQIVKSHGGTIKVGSRADEGASFVITLPLP